MSTDSSPSSSSTRSRVTRLTSRIKDLNASPKKIQATIRLSSAAQGLFDKTRSNGKTVLSSFTSRQNTTDKPPPTQDDKAPPTTSQSENRRPSSATQSIVERAVSGSRNVLDRFPSRKVEEGPILERQISPSPSQTHSQAPTKRLSLAAQALLTKTVQTTQTALSTLAARFDEDSDHTKDPIRTEIHILNTHGISLEGMLRSISGLCLNLQRDIHKAGVTEELDKRAGRICAQAASIEELLEPKTVRIAVCGLVGTDKWDFLERLVGGAFVSTLRIAEDHTRTGLLLELVPAPGKSGCHVQAEFTTSDKAKTILLDAVQVLHSDDEAEVDKVDARSMFDALGLPNHDILVPQLRDTILEFDYDERVGPMRDRKFKKNETDLENLKVYLQTLQHIRPLVNKVTIHLDSSLLSSGIGLVLIPDIASLSGRLSVQHALSRCEELVFVGTLPEADTALQSELYDALADTAIQSVVEGFYGGRVEASPRLILLQKIQPIETRKTRHPKPQHPVEPCHQFTTHLRQSPETFHRFTQSRIHLVPFFVENTQDGKGEDGMLELELWLKRIGIARREMVLGNVARGALITLISNTRIWKDEELDYGVVVEGVDGEDHVPVVGGDKVVGGQDKVVVDNDEEEEDKEEEEEEESESDEVETEEEDIDEDAMDEDSETSVSEDEQEVILTAEEQEVRAQFKKDLANAIVTFVISDIRKIINDFSSYFSDKRLDNIQLETEEVTWNRWSRIAYNTFQAACRRNGEFSISLNQDLADVFAKSINTPFGKLANWTPPKFDSVPASGELKIEDLLVLKLNALALEIQHTRDVINRVEATVEEWFYKLKLKETIRKTQYTTIHTHRLWFQTALKSAYQECYPWGGKGVHNKRLRHLNDAISDLPIKTHLRKLSKEQIVDKLETLVSGMERGLRRDLLPFLASLDLELDKARRMGRRKGPVRADVVPVSQEERCGGIEVGLGKAPVRATLVPVSQKEKYVRTEVSPPLVKVEKKVVEPPVEATVQKADRRRQIPLRNGKKSKQPAEELVQIEVEAPAETNIEKPFLLTRVQADAITEAKRMIFDRYYKYMTVLERRAIGPV